ncbi:RNA polymerase sigma factor [Pseudobythopirellula maris]|uniref:RNA polymerase sigma factor n=1 Tax=Pseudobythopirellula maris TaxID=2527991 RepID=A0A5C5ZJV5_9BACT|nr:sigma factor [Pseudobythopirellula maris]TWT87516.1 RNA polymerase sigma factor [Pseudobythopirellula maris]
MPENVLVIEREEERLSPHESSGKHHEHELLEEVNERHYKQAPLPSSNWPLRTASPSPANSLSTTRHSDLCLIDREMIDRCVRGDIDAWQTLYDQFHSVLLRSIAAMLRGSTGEELVEEVASRVWCALAENDGALLDRYDPQRGARFITFLRLIARDELKRHFRSEGRRKQRELTVGSARPRIDCEEHHLWARLDEFLCELTPAERKFFNEVLVPEGGAEESKEDEYTKSNFWQLRHRIREKLQLHLEY